MEVCTIPKRCVSCVHHKKGTVLGTDYCDYVEHWNGYAGTPVPYPNFFKEDYPCKGHKIKETNNYDE